MIEYFTFQEISKNKKIGRNINQTAKFLNLDRKTVAKYWNVSNSEFIKMSTQETRRKRKSKCDSLKPRIVELIKDINEISTSAIYDRLAEESEAELDFTERTLNNYVRVVRKELGIPKQPPSRDHQAVEELPPGCQAQVDFGEIHLRCASNPKKRKKIYFFIMVLRFSRYKYVEFSDTKFTSEMAIQAHMHAFEYFGGIPHEIVYDQDRVFIISENEGDIMATVKFKSFLAMMPFTYYIARPADPQTKGCVEKYVSFTKHNFLYGRLFVDIEQLNEEGLKWLERTGNGKVCQATNERPVDRLEYEQQALFPLDKIPDDLVFDEIITHKVNKDNTITYHGNRYRVPVGTYNLVKNQEVGVLEKEGQLFILDLLTHDLIISHTVADGKGHLVGQKEQKPLSSVSVDEIISAAAAFIPFRIDPSVFLEQVCLKYKRYIPEQMKIISDAIHNNWDDLTPDILQKTLNSCLSLELISAHDFKKFLDNYCELARMDKNYTFPNQDWEDPSVQAAFSEEDKCLQEVDKEARLASLWEISTNEAKE